jgi:N-acetylmuramoyl-L-alanine amidase
MKPRGIVLHTVGVRGDTTAGAIRRFHMQSNGWSDIGYHRVVRKSGVIDDGRALWRMGAHTQGANDTLGVCVTGDGDSEPWTPQLHEAVLNLCAAWCRHYGWTAAQVCGHREAERVFGADKTSKTCPGKLVDLDALRKALTERLNSSPVQGDRA